MAFKVKDKKLAELGKGLLLSGGPAGFFQPTKALMHKMLAIPEKHKELSKAYNKILKGRQLKLLSDFHFSSNKSKIGTILDTISTSKDTFSSIPLSKTKREVDSLEDLLKEIKRKTKPKKGKN